MRRAEDCSLGVGHGQAWTQLLTAVEPGGSGVQAQLPVAAKLGIISYRDVGAAIFLPRDIAVASIEEGDDARRVVGRPCNVLEPAIGTGEDGVEQGRRRI